MPSAERVIRLASPEATLDLGRALARGLSAGAYIAAATHDTRLITSTIATAERLGLGRARFELQMLYGVRPALQQAYVAKGFKVLVATPYGPEWYPYLMRRLAERPANVAIFARNALRR